MPWADKWEVPICQNDKDMVPASQSIQDLTNHNKNAARRERILFETRNHSHQQTEKQPWTLREFFLTIPEIGSHRESNLGAGGATQESSYEPFHLLTITTYIH